MLKPGGMQRHQCRDVIPKKYRKTTEQNARLDFEFVGLDFNNAAQENAARRIGNVLASRRSAATGKATAAG